jgi:hypothetical protein
MDSDQRARLSRAECAVALMGYLVLFFSDDWSGADHGRTDQ